MIDNIQSNKKLYQEIKEKSLFDSIYTIPCEYTSERRMLEMLNLINKAIDNVRNVARLYDNSELLNQKEDVATVKSIDHIADDLEDLRVELFGTEINYERLVELGFEQLDELDKLCNEYLNTSTGEKKKK